MFTILNKFRQQFSVKMSLKSYSFQGVFPLEPTRGIALKPTRGIALNPTRALEWDPGSHAMRLTHVVHFDFNTGDPEFQPSAGFWPSGPLPWPWP